MAVFQEGEPNKGTGMKEFIKMMVKDSFSGFTRKECVIYGIVAPAIYVVVAILASIIE